MADPANTQDNSQKVTDKSPTARRARAERREIPGNFPYTTTPGVFAKVLERIPISERPPQFTQDFLASVLQTTGGSARPIIPILKKAGLLRPDGVPTEAYSQFQSNTGRPQAALEALRTGWPELFRRNQYANRVDDKSTEDLFRQVTGLPASDPVLKSMVATYNVIKKFAADAPEISTATPDKPDLTQPAERPQADTLVGSGVPLTLSNQINIVLPETTDISVYHAIFRSLRDNLLR